MTIVLSHLACGFLLQQHQETDTDEKFLRTIKCSEIYLNKHKKNIGGKTNHQIS